MAVPLAEWVESEVDPVKDRPVSWLSSNHFFRDPARATIADRGHFYAPADGVIVYQRQVTPDDAVVEVKGSRFTVRDLLREPHFDRECLVIGTFMTFYDVHVNRVPYPGRLSYRQLPPIATVNRPMLDMESSLVDRLRIDTGTAAYLRSNQRTVNRVDVLDPALSYWMVQVADYDVDSIMPFDLRQNVYRSQGRRFSQIRYGSQVDLVVPLGPGRRLTPVQQVGWHVQAGVDPLLRIERA